MKYGNLEKNDARKEARLQVRLFGDEKNFLTLDQFQTMWSRLQATPKWADFREHAVHKRRIAQKNAYASILRVGGGSPPPLTKVLFVVYIAVFSVVYPSVLYVIPRLASGDLLLPPLADYPSLLNAVSVAINVFFINYFAAPCSSRFFRFFLATNTPPQRRWFLVKPFMEALENGLTLPWQIALCLVYLAVQLGCLFGIIAQRGNKDYFNDPSEFYP